MYCVVLTFTTSKMSSLAYQGTFIYDEYAKQHLKQLHQFRASISARTEYIGVAPVTEVKLFQRDLYDVRNVNTYLNICSIYHN